MEPTLWYAIPKRDITIERTKENSLIKPLDRYYEYCYNYYVELLRDLPYRVFNRTNQSLTRSY
jgi:hypothetical protein